MGELEEGRQFFAGIQAALVDPDPTDPDRLGDFAHFRRACEAVPDGCGSDHLTAATAQIICAAVSLRRDAGEHSDGGEEDSELDLALTAVLHAFRAHRCIRQLAAKRRGTP